MTAIVKKTLGYVVADSILNDIRNKKSRYYYFLSKTIDDTATVQVDSLDYELNARNEMVLLKSITAADVCLVVPRINWASGVLFNSADSGVVAPSNYYCVTAAFNVYKCLYNGGVVASQFEPVGTGVDPVVYPDGYKWKFLFNIPLALRNKFLTYEFMPVVTSLNSRFFSNGSIDSVSILANGSGYSQATTSIAVNGDGAGALLKPVVQDGQVVDVIVENAGYGYSSVSLEVESTQVAASAAVVAPNLSLGDVNNPQAVVEMLTYRGTVDSVIVTAPGAGYTTASAAIVGDGTGAVANVVVANGEIKEIKIVDSGVNYTQATVVITGNGANAAARVAVSPPLGHGRNTPEELQANTLMFFQSLSREKYASVYIDNDFRQYGIIRNPRNALFGSNISNPANANSYAIRCTFGPVTGVSNFAVGDVVRKVVDAIVHLYTIQYITTSTKNAIQQYAMLLSGDGTEIVAGDTLVKVADPSKSLIAVDSVAQALVDTNLACTCYSVGGAGDVTQFPVDSEILNLYDTILPSRRFRVVAQNVTLNLLLLLPLDGGAITTGDVLNKSNSAITFVAGTTVAPNVDKLTGEIILIDTRLAFNQTEDQTVTFRTLIKF